MSVSISPRKNHIWQMHTIKTVHLRTRNMAFTHRHFNSGPHRLRLVLKKCKCSSRTPPNILLLPSNGFAFVRVINCNRLVTTGLTFVARSVWDTSFPRDEFLRHAFSVAGVMEIQPTDEINSKAAEYRPFSQPLTNDNSNSIFREQY